MTKTLDAIKAHIGALPDPEARAIADAVGMDLAAHGKWDDQDGEGAHQVERWARDARDDLQRGHADDALGTALLYRRPRALVIFAVWRVDGHR